MRDFSLNSRFLVSLGKLKGLAMLGHKAVPGRCSAAATSLDKAWVLQFAADPTLPYRFLNPTGLTVCRAAEGPPSTAPI